VNAVLGVTFLYYGGTFMIVIAILASGALGFLNAKAGNLF
jgi:hypothetical protein